MVGVASNRVGIGVAWIVGGWVVVIGCMVAIGVGFAIFLVETRVGSRAVRVRSELLQHTVDDAR